MSHKHGAHVNGIRTLKDLRIRCRVDDVTGCWNWSLSTSHGRPSVTIRGEDGKHHALTGRRVSLILSGRKLSKSDEVWQSPKCPSKLCVNPDHCCVGTHSGALKAAHLRTGWKHAAAAQAAGHRIKAIMAKLDDAKAAEIRNSSETHKVLAERFGVSPSAISLVKRGETWKPPASVNSVFAWRA